jgi:hypothetical protein
VVRFLTAVGLDYEFRELIRSAGGRHHDKGDANQSFQQGREDSTIALHAAE